jgi:hypothetical protein
MSRAFPLLKLLLCEETIELLFDTVQNRTPPRYQDPLPSATMFLSVAVVVNAILVGCLVVWVAREK